MNFANVTDSPTTSAKECFVYEIENEQRFKPHVWCSISVTLFRNTHLFTVRFALSSTDTVHILLVACGLVAVLLCVLVTCIACVVCRRRQRREDKQNQTAYTNNSFNYPSAKPRYAQWYIYNHMSQWAQLNTLSGNPYKCWQNVD